VNDYEDYVQEGKDSFLRGHDRGDNPYAIGTRERRAWSAGFAAAEAGSEDDVPLLDFSA
jgi:hypothetical protein